MLPRLNPSCIPLNHVLKLSELPTVQRMLNRMVRVHLLKNMHFLSQGVRTRLPRVGVWHIAKTDKSRHPTDTLCSSAPCIVEFAEGIHRKTRIGSTERVGCQ